jgi:hypothetical protein
MDFAAGQHGRVAQLQLAGGERRDRSLLLTSDLIRERAGLHTKHDGLARLIDGAVGARESEGFDSEYYAGRWHHAANWWERKLRYVAAFWAAHRASRWPACNSTSWSVGPEAQ